MGTVRILIAEDDTHFREGLADTLQSEGYAVVVVGDGEAALDKIKHERFDLLILDVMMPKKSGYDVCQELKKEEHDIPVMMLTAKGEEIDKVVGLKLGADDYMTKPFGIHELLARIEAILRRCKNTKGRSKQRKLPERFSFGNAVINAKTYEATVGKKTVPVTARELQLLLYFHENPHEVLSRNRLLDAVWGIEYYGNTRTLDQHIAQLRKKIEPRPDKPQFIVTVQNIGYRYLPPQAR
jgi:DNA-binding response OmpR family regulator